MDEVRGEGYLDRAFVPFSAVVLPPGTNGAIDAHIVVTWAGARDRRRTI